MIKTYTDISGQYLIDGEWIESEDIKDVRNRAQISETVEKVALCTREEVRRAVDVAKKSFKNWSRTEPQERADIMKRAAKRLSETVEEHVPLFVQENGKTIVEAKTDSLRFDEVMAEGDNTL